MLKEIPKDNWFSRTFSVLIGTKELSYNYFIPDILDYPIAQPQGVFVLLKGPKDNLDIICQTPTGDFNFQQLSPQGTTFSIADSKYSNFSASAREKKVSFPCNSKYYQHQTVFCLFHEIGHCWSQMDQSWYDQVHWANQILKTQLFSQAIDGYIWLSDAPEERTVELQAWEIKGEEEQRSTAASLFLIGYLINAGLDPLPHATQSRKLSKLVNKYLIKHEKFGIRLRFSTAEIENFLAGNLPWPDLQDTITIHTH